MEGFSQAADSNKHAILKVLAEWLFDASKVIEVGSGSGQHAIHFANALKGISWQPTEQAGAIANLTRNIVEHGGDNICPPVALDLSSGQWPLGHKDCVYAANVIHIVSEALGQKLIQGAANLLADDGLFLLYGPFKYQGEFTTLSNADFDQWLKARDPRSGVRDFEWVCEQAKDAGLTLVEDRQMPANNQMLRFQR